MGLAAWRGLRGGTGAEAEQALIAASARMAEVVMDSIFKAGCWVFGAREVQYIDRRLGQGDGGVCRQARKGDGLRTLIAGLANV